jgi:hypothetical protein
MQCQFIPVIQIFMNIYLIIAQFNFIYAQLWLIYQAASGQGQCTFLLFI